MTRLQRWVVISSLFGAIGTITTVNAAPETVSLGSVHVPRNVLADGKTLPAGTYQLRATTDVATPAVGQSADAERWVEFVKGGRTIGRELATVVAAKDISTIAKGPRPAPDGSRVDLLRGGSYLRIWIARNGTNYLVNLPTSS